ncbi:MAG: four helix bundle protein [Bacteroidales bacterium]|nr:four helix bundle protein [Bacteroidales bacterium]
MSTVSRFEDLEIWKIARSICHDIYLLTNTKPFKNDFSLVDQIKRSSGSIMDNIAEGFERDGKKEFGQFLSFSKGSAGETRSQLYRAFDYSYITEDQLIEMKNKLLQLSTKISNMMSYLKQSAFNGTKFKTT